MKPETRRQILAGLHSLTAIAIVVAFLAYLWGSRETLAATIEVSWAGLAAVAVGVILHWLVNAGQSLLLYRAEGLRIGLMETTFLTVMGGALNYMPFRLGTVVRLRYLKTVHRLRFTRAASVVGIRLVLLVVATAVLGQIGLLFLYVDSGQVNVELSVVFVVLLLVSCAAAYWPPPKVSGQNAVFRVWNDFSQGLSKIRTHPRVASGVLVLIFAQLLLMGGRFYVSLALVGSEVPLATLILLSSTATLVSFVSIVPGGLGLREVVMGYVTLATGHDFNVGLFAGAIDRAVLLGLLFTIGLVSLVYVWGRLRQSENRI